MQKKKLNAFKKQKPFPQKINMTLVCQALVNRGHHKRPFLRGCNTTQIAGWAIFLHLTAHCTLHGCSWSGQADDERDLHILIVHTEDLLPIAMTLRLCFSEEARI